MEELAVKAEEKIEVKDSNVVEKRKKTLKNFLFGWVKDNYDKVFIIVLILTFAIRIGFFIITKNQPMWFDEAEYLSTAKYWAGMAGHMTDVWYYRRGFFWPLFCSLFFRTGLGEITIRFVTVLFSTGIVAVSYFLIRDMFNKKYALFASIGLAFSWVALFFTGRVMTDIPATFLLLLSLLFFWKGYELKQGNKFVYLSVIFLAISVLTRMQNVMFVPFFFLLVFFKEKFAFLKNKVLWIALLIFLITLLPHFIMYNQHFGNPVTDIASWYLGVKTEAVPVARASFTNWFIYFKDFPYNLTIPIFILFIIGALYFFADIFLGFDKIFKNKNIQNKLFVFLWIVIPLLLLGYMQADPNAQQRYTMLQHPFLFMIAAIPLFEIGKLIEKNSKFNKKFIMILLMVVFVATLIPNLVWGYQLTENKLNSYLEVKQAGEWLKQNSNINDSIITNSFPHISYYSERRVKSFGDCYNTPESHKPECNESEFDAFVKDTKPRFMILSIFENHEDWQINYPQVHNETWTPIKAYQQNNKPVLIIYEANYKKSKNVGE